MVNLKEYRTVILAALLHDVGKFLQRGSFGSLDTTGKHPAVSGVFVSAYSNLFGEVTDTTLLKTLVERHHETTEFPFELRVQDISDAYTRSLAYLVSTADNLSSSERDEASEEYKYYKSTPLACVFGRITTGSGSNGKILHHHPRAFKKPDALASIFPETFTEYAPGEMNELLKGFGDEFSQFASRVNTGDFPTLLTHLTSLLHKYTATVPANTQEEIPDVSLYDHLRTTAAVAAALYQYHSSNSTLDERYIKRPDGNEFLLAVGDLSGIQNYIMGITSARTGGVARRLRARSLFVQTITEIAAHKILRELDLPVTNIVMASGGKFYLLLPNTYEAVTAVTQAQKDVDQWLLGELHGELAINLATLEFGREGFQARAGQAAGFGYVLESINHQLQKRKQQAFRESLLNGQGWDEEAFLRPTSFAGEQPCAACHKLPGTIEGSEGERICGHCSRDFNWGKQLPNTKYVAFYGDDEGGDFSLMGWSISLRETPDFPGSPCLVTKLNETGMSELIGYPAQWKYLANYIPEYDCESCPAKETCDDKPRTPEGPATFNCIARHSRGTALLGFLKADVDNLGKLSIFGLKRHAGKQYDTISRVATFSRMLDVFFSGWIENLARNEFPHCYTVFSGGDDLFLVGPWEEVLELAEQIRKEFGRYTGNPELTLSAGAFLNKSRYPISRASMAADSDLDSSKTRNGNQKDAMTTLGHTLEWQDWGFVREQWHYLQSSGEEMPSAFAYNLLRYAEMWRDYSHNGDVLGLRFQPLLAYNLARTGDSRKMPILYEWAEKLLRIPTNDEQRRILDNLRLIASLLIYSRRGGS